MESAPFVCALRPMPMQWLTVSLLSSNEAIRTNMRRRKLVNEKSLNFDFIECQIYALRKMSTERKKKYNMTAQPHTQARIACEKYSQRRARTRQSVEEWEIMRRKNRKKIIYWHLFTWMSSFFNSSINTAMGYNESSDALSLAAIIPSFCTFPLCSLSRTEHYARILDALVCI